jgi:hypothetical protein
VSKEELRKRRSVMEERKKGLELMVSLSCRACLGAVMAEDEERKEGEGAT